MAVETLKASIPNLSVTRFSRIGTYLARDTFSLNCDSRASLSRRAALPNENGCGSANAPVQVRIPLGS